MVPNSRIVEGGEFSVSGIAGDDDFAPAGAISSSVAIGELRASLALVQLLALNSIFEVAQSADRDAEPVERSVRRLLDNARSASVGVDALARAWADRPTSDKGRDRGGERDVGRAGTGDDDWLQLLAALAKGSMPPPSRRELPN